MRFEGDPKLETASQNSVGKQTSSHRLLYMNVFGLEWVNSPVCFNGFVGAPDFSLR